MSDQHPDAKTQPGDRSSTADDPLARSALDITVDAERVWQALICDGGLEPWMGAGARIDPRVDGTLLVPDPVGGRTRRGRIEVADAGRRLEFSWWPENRPIERSRVSITLTPIETGTRVVVTETVPRTISRSLRADARSGTASAPTGPPAMVTAPPVATPRSLSGSWAWRLAMLTLACGLVRV